MKARTRKPVKRIEVRDDGTVVVVDLAKRREKSKQAWINRGSPMPGVKQPPKPQPSESEIAAEASMAAELAAARQISVRDAKRRQSAFLRDFRKRTRETVVEQGNRVAPTPLTRLRHRKTSFARMCDKREVTGEMLEAAQEIDMVYMAITGALFGRSMPLEPRSPGAKATMSDRIAEAHTRRFKPWADALSKRRNHGAPPSLELVIDVVVDGRSLSDIDAERGWRNGFGKYLVRRALLEYAVVARWAPMNALDNFDAQAGYSPRQKGYG